MVARLKRPGWEARWGSEEKDRVAGALAGVMAVEGMAAGFETAGGLDTKERSASADGDSAATAIPTEVHVAGDSLPNDVAELKEMVGRRFPLCNVALFFVVLLCCRTEKACFFLLSCRPCLQIRPANYTSWMAKSVGHM